MGAARGSATRQAKSPLAEGLFTPAICAEGRAKAHLSPYRPRPRKSYLQSAQIPSNSTTGLVQQTAQIAATRDLALFVRLVKDAEPLAVLMMLALLFEARRVAGVMPVTMLKSLAFLRFDALWQVEAALALYTNVQEARM